MVPQPGKFYYLHKLKHTGWVYYRTKDKAILGAVGKSWEDFFDWDHMCATRVNPESLKSVGIFRGPDLDGVVPIFEDYE